jgi:putative endonuclease
MAVTASRNIGDIGEGIAVEFLERRGYRIVDRNAFVDRDEIDVIYEGEDGLAAVEVKTTQSGSDPFDAVTDTKLHRIARAVAGYGYPIVSIDVIGVILGSDGVEVRWLRGIN